MIHNKLIDELFGCEFNLTERDHAAKNEIAALRKEIKRLEEELAEAKKPKPVKKAAK